MGRYGTAWRGTASSGGAPRARFRLQPPAMATPRDQNAIVIDRAVLEAEVERLVTAADEAGLTVRVLGSLGVSIHCPDAAALLPSFQRTYADIDFARHRRP